MNVFCLPSTFFRCIFQPTIYSLFLAVVSLLYHPTPCFSQEIGAYKTRTSGDFNLASTWEVWNGSQWVNANQKPRMENDIYIDQGHTVKLQEPESVKSLYIHAGVGAGQKVNLNNLNLDIYGVLAAFSGSAPGQPRGAWNSKNWIGNSPTSTLTFKGKSRVIVNKESWSAQNTQSRFGVIIDPEIGQELTLKAPLKALYFDLRSGTLYQKSDHSSSTSSCNTISFNTETAVFGSDAFGTFTIGPGATFRSTCNSLILTRTTSKPALLVELKQDATLLLEGENPKIEVANYILDGTLIQRGNQDPINFLSSNLSSSSKPTRIHHLVLEGDADLLLPSHLTIQGDLIQHGKGMFQLASTQLTLSGPDDQSLRTKVLLVEALTLQKPSGKVMLYCDLNIYKSLTMEEGIFDFNGVNLLLNISGLGAFNYLGGRWYNLRQFSFFGLPSHFTKSNGTFPFEDLENGGFRGLQFLGPTPNGGNLRVHFFPYPGANHDANFKDKDQTEIMYQLNSFFKLTVDPRLGLEELEIRIAADSLLLDQIKDIRIVSRGKAAPGLSLPGEKIEFPWARRKLSWQELYDTEVTIGSYREASVLPIKRKN